MAESKITVKIEVASLADALEALAADAITAANAIRATEAGA